MIHEDLTPLITEVEVLRRELGFSRLSQLTPWCDPGQHPATCDGGGMSRLIERLSTVAVERGLYG